MLLRPPAAPSPPLGPTLPVPANGGFTQWTSHECLVCPTRTRILLRGLWSHNPFALWRPARTSPVPIPVPVPVPVPGFTARPGRWWCEAGEWQGACLLISGVVLLRERSQAAGGLRPWELGPVVHATRKVCAKQTGARGVLWGHTEQSKSTGMHARSRGPASLAWSCQSDPRQLPFGGNVSCTCERIPLCNDSSTRAARPSAPSLLCLPRCRSGLKGDGTACSGGRARSPERASSVSAKRGPERVLAALLIARSFPGAGGGSGLRVPVPSGPAYGVPAGGGASPRE